VLVVPAPLVVHAAHPTDPRLVLVGLVAVVLARVAGALLAVVFHPNSQN
jgi:hypothetical protein